MAFRGDLEALILGALQDGPLHGYAIARRIQASSDGCLRFGEGQLYPALHKLEDSGLVKSEWFFQEGKPSKKTYSVTEIGVQELARQVHQWEKFVRGVSRVLRPEPAGGALDARPDSRVRT
jgi:DNA-binding PadR family transcriptional regulator